MQIFLSDPQGWKKPPPRDDAEELRASEIPLYVHAPYLINVCSPKNNVRYGSRKILQQTCEAAAEIAAAAVIVHPGHAEDGIDAGIGRWARTLDMLESRMSRSISRTPPAATTRSRAGSTPSLGCGRWSRSAKTDVTIGFCFDTCHAHAAGEELSDAVERVLAIVGRIDLLHANDSRDPPGTGADRHANLGKGEIGADALREMIRAANAPVICETPGRLDDDARDLGVRSRGAGRLSDAQYTSATAR